MRNEVTGAGTQMDDKIRMYYVAVRPRRGDTKRVELFVSRRAAGRFATGAMLGVVEIDKSSAEIAIGSVDISGRDIAEGRAGADMAAKTSKQLAQFTRPPMSSGWMLLSGEYADRAELEIDLAAIGVRRDEAGSAITRMAA